MPTHVQSTGTTGATGHGVTSISKSFATPNVDGNLIVVDGAGWNSVGPPGVSTVDDNAGSATYQQGIHMENVNTTLATYYQTNVASANPFTVTITWLNAANCSISAHEYSSAGAKTASNLAGGTGQSVASGSVAPAGTNLYHGVGCYVTGSSQSFTLTWGGATERGNYDSTNAPATHCCVGTSKCPP